jgi:hypothetical protein
MNRKVLSILGVVLLIFALQSCSSNPEKGLLDRYFNALSLNDITTLSTMAIDPITFEFDSWDITSVSEGLIEPTQLPGLSAGELDFKKKVEESVGITLDARDALDDATFERDNARTRSARTAAQKKVDEMQVKYDEQYAIHQQLQKDYNLTKENAAKEEEISSFSLGGEYANIRDFSGERYSKEVEVRITGKEGTNHYKIYLRRYLLKDEASNMSHRGRWIIIRFEKLD